MGEYRALIDLQTHELFEGELSGRIRHMIQEWMDVCRLELMRNWNEGQGDNPSFAKAPPLRKEHNMIHMIKEIVSVEPDHLLLRFNTGVYMMGQQTEESTRQMPFLAA
jgi:hypothetical protein